MAGRDGVQISCPMCRRVCDPTTAPVKILNSECNICRSTAVQFTVLPCDHRMCSTCIDNIVRVAAGYSALAEEERVPRTPAGAVYRGPADRGGHPFCELMHLCPVPLSLRLRAVTVFNSALSDDDRVGMLGSLYRRVIHARTARNLIHAHDCIVCLGRLSTTARRMPPLVEAFFDALERCNFGDIPSVIFPVHRLPRASLP
jgi:hypothetical protein